jgi:hypothetical protein
MSEEQLSEERERRSGKPSRNFVVDSLILSIMLAMVGTGLVIRYVLPPGSGGRGVGSGLVLWGLDRHDWGGLHFWLAVALVALLVLHVALHWRWVSGFVRRRLVGGARAGRASRRTETIFGVGFVGLLVVLTLSFWWLSEASVSRVGPGGERAGRATRSEVGRGHTGGEEIRGSMTLAEASRAAGIPVEALRETLGLPAGVAGSERLGRLKRRYSFEMEDVREAVATHRRQR